QPTTTLNTYTTLFQTNAKAVGVALKQRKLLRLGPLVVGYQANDPLEDLISGLRVADSHLLRKKSVVGVIGPCRPGGRCHAFAVAQVALCESSNLDLQARRGTMEFVDPTVDSAAKPRGAHLTENLEWRHDPTAIEVYSVVVPWNAGGEMNADERRSLRVVVGHVPGRLGSCMNVDLRPGLVERDVHVEL